MAVSYPSVKGTLIEWTVISLLLAPSFYPGFVEPTLFCLSPQGVSRDSCVHVCVV